MSYGARKQCDFCGGEYYLGTDLSVYGCPCLKAKYAVAKASRALSQHVQPKVSQDVLLGSKVQCEDCWEEYTKGVNRQLYGCSCFKAQARVVQVQRQLWEQQQRTQAIRAQEEATYEHIRRRSSEIKPPGRNRRRSSYLTDDQLESLERKLAQREMPRKVVPNVRVAPAIRRASLQLERSINKDNLGHLLEGRHSYEDLVAWGIAPKEQAAPSIQSKAQKLKMQLAKSNLYHGLARRPSLVEMVQAGYIDDPGAYDDEYDEYGEPREYGIDDAWVGENYDSEADEDYVPGEDDYDEEEEYYEDDEPEAYEEGQDAPLTPAREFDLLRLLFTWVGRMHADGEISYAQKSVLKRMMLAQDSTILAVAGIAMEDGDIDELKDSLLRLSLRE